MILEFREEGFHLLSLPLRQGKCWCRGERASDLSCSFVHVDGEILVFPAGALGFQRACTTALAVSDVDMGTVAYIQSHIVELLACGAAIAVALRLVGETLGSIERAVLSVNAVPSAHIRSD